MQAKTQAGLFLRVLSAWKLSRLPTVKHSSVCYVPSSAYSLR